MILILGGNGFIGYNLVKRLARREKIRVFDKTWKHGKDNSNIEVLTGDFCDTDFEALLEEVDTVFHLISSSVPFDGTDGVIQDIEDNLLPTIRFMDVAKRKEVKKLFFISSGGTVYGECSRPAREYDRLSPECIYAAQKAWIETCVHLYEKYDGIMGYVLRVGNPYGLEINREKGQGIIPIFIEKIINDDFIEVWGTGENRRDYIYVDEVIDAIEAVYSYQGKHRVFNIGTGSSHSTLEIIKWIESALGREAKIIYKEARECDLLEACMDVTLIQNECGWRSKLTVEQGIRSYINMFMNNV